MNRKRKKSGEFVDIYLETCGKQYLKGENGYLVVAVGGN